MKWTNQQHVILQKATGSNTVTELPVPKYRATCYRTGTNHSFSSPQVGHRLGGVIQDRFGWQVNLTGYDIEVGKYHILDMTHWVVP